MNIDFAAHLSQFAEHAGTWGYLFIFVFMAVESSFIPFPSEVVMVPAGFLAARGELSCGTPWLDFGLAVVIGTLGSLLGAYVNYALACKMGEPFLRRYGKYFFIKPEVLDRSEELFRRYGDMTTFVCRLLPVIRQLISLPAGLSRMPLGRFSFFTCLGAGIWSIILAGAGFYFGKMTADMDYPKLIEESKAVITHNYGWIILGLVLFCAAYIALQKAVMKSPKSRKPQGKTEE